MIPADALHKIRSVNIHHDNRWITGFSFFDKDGALLWEIGYTTARLTVETVILAENEVIVGVVAKLCPGKNILLYTDFQFQIALEWRDQIWNLDTHSGDKQ